jgi:hypothetical protein
VLEKEEGVKEEGQVLAKRDEMAKDEMANVDFLRGCGPLTNSHSSHTHRTLLAQP